MIAAGLPVWVGLGFAVLVVFRFIFRLSWQVMFWTLILSAGLYYGIRGGVIALITK